MTYLKAANLAVVIFPDRSLQHLPDRQLYEAEGQVSQHGGAETAIHATEEPFGLVCLE